MVVGILVFNKLVSKDGIPDKKLKERAGYGHTAPPPHPHPPPVFLPAQPIQWMAFGDPPPFSAWGGGGCLS